MNKNLENTILEMFGEPMKPLFGTKVGDVPGIAKTGIVGVPSIEEMGAVCGKCGMMTVDGKCGCPMQTDHGVTCPVCNKMPVEIEKPCACEMTTEAKEEAEMHEGEEADESKAYGGKEPDYTNISKATAKKRLETIKDKYGSDWKDMLKAFSWAESPEAALSTLHKKAYGKWPSEK